jgi:pimeloyl-ACP methyl ester carboxylesterase
MRSLLFVVVPSVLLAACSSIAIDEETVFQPKPSVTPQTFSLDGVDLAVQSIPVADTVTVNAWHLTQDAAETTVLFFGGNGFYLVQSRGYLRALTRPPTDALLWDYRGYGRSGGSPSAKTLRSDALAVYDSLVSRPDVRPEEVIAWGHSLGSFMATHVAQERTVGGVVLENPATNVDDWTSHLFPWYVRLFLGVDVDPALKDDDNLERVQSITAPLLVVAGTEDPVTAPEMARRLYQEAASEDRELILVDGGTHNGLYEEPEVQDAYRSLVARVDSTGQQAVSP